MLLILDGPRHHTDRPTLFFGARGIARLTLTTFGPLFPQHSGTFGNYAPDPALGMSRLLTSMKDTLGRVTIPGFYEGVDLTEAERAVLAAVPDNEADILAHLGVKVPDRVATSYQEAMQYPSLTILGLQSGWTGAQTRTIVPATAVAELDIRLVPEIPAERLVALIKDHIRHQGFHLIAGQYPTPEERASHANLARLEYRVAYNAFRTPLASPAAAWARSALTRAFSEEPVQIRMMGGSIPIAPFVEALGIPAIGVPTVYLENNQHSPNENLRFGNYVEGIQTFMSLLSEPVTFR
ncbi:peptidase dimerization domain-containing protein [Kordiimonas gwangyangensis]|uniref:peptidase dimerization domain-containing protein n=1 Tax=Kordiimonas gwangyangensis TaxID=288022 RepID=UPI0012DDA5FF